MCTECFFLLYRLMRCCETFLRFTKWSKRTILQLQITEMLKCEVHFLLHHLASTVNVHPVCVFVLLILLYPLTATPRFVFLQTVNVVLEVHSNLCFSPPASVGLQRNKCQFVFLISPVSVSGVVCSCKCYSSCD